MLLIVASGHHSCLQLLYFVAKKVYFWHLVQNFAVSGNREALNFEQFFSSVDENFVATAFYFGLAESFLTLQMLSKFQ